MSSEKESPLTGLSPLLQLISSLTFGALFANAVLFLLFIYNPQLFPPSISHKGLIMIGTIVGTLLHRAIHAAIFNPLTKTLARSLAFYGNLVELHMLRNKHLVSEEEYAEISRNLKRSYFGLPPVTIPPVSNSVVIEQIKASPISTLEAPKPALPAPSLHDGNTNITTTTVEAESLQLANTGSSKNNKKKNRRRTPKLHQTTTSTSQEPSLDTPPDIPTS